MDLTAVNSTLNLIVGIMALVGIAGFADLAFRARVERASRQHRLHPEAQWTIPGFRDDRQ